MKTFNKVLLALACVSLLLACSKSDEQATPASSNHSLKSVNDKGNGTNTAFYEGFGFISSVFCDGKEVDVLRGEGQAHVVDHWESIQGNIGFLIFQMKGTATNEAGENFTFSEQDKMFYDKPADSWYTVHTNVNGDKGSLYHVYFMWSDTQNRWIVKTANCTGNVE